MSVKTFTREANQCYICAKEFTQKDVDNEDITYYMERPCCTRHNGVPKSEGWIKKNAERIERERKEEEIKRQKELADWDEY
jgi:hypothetical protein